MNGDPVRPRPEASEATAHNLLDQLVHAVGLVDFKEKQQEWFCHVCCYRDPLGMKLHADGCRYMEFSRQLDAELDALRQQLAEAKAANEELIKQGLELGEELIAVEAERARLKEQYEYANECADMLKAAQLEVAQAWESHSIVQGNLRVEAEKRLILTIALSALFRPKESSPIQHVASCALWKGRKCNCEVAKLAALLAAQTEKENK